MCTQRTAQNPFININDCLYLNLDIPASLKVAVITLIATGLKLIWDKRKEGKIVYPRDIAAEIEARKYILSKSKYEWAGKILTDAIQDFPT